MIKPNVTNESAGRLGSLLLKNIEVQKIIQDAQIKTSEKLEITRDLILARHEEIYKDNRKADDKIAIQSLQEESKILGFYAAEKHENINRNLEAEVTNDEIDSILEKYDINKRVKDKRKEDKMVVSA